MDFSSLGPLGLAAVAAVATVASAVIAATAALVSTLISGWNGRKLEAQAALRGYRQERLQPAIDDAELRIRGVFRVLHCGGSPMEELYPDGSPPPSRKVFVTPGRELHEAGADFAKWDYWCWYVFGGQAQQVPTKAERDWLLDRLERAAFVFREAVENYLFGQRFQRSLSKSLALERKGADQELRRIMHRLEVSDEEIDARSQADQAV